VSAYCALAVEPVQTAAAATAKSMQRWIAADACGPDRWIKEWQFIGDFLIKEDVTTNGALRCDRQARQEGPLLHSASFWDRTAQGIWKKSNLVGAALPR
jgi:hypothetical protein